MAQTIPPALEAELKKYDNLRRMHESESALLQAVQTEMLDVKATLDELRKQPDDAVTYKAVGQVMFKVEKTALVEELEERERTLEIRKNKAEKSIKALTDQLNELQKTIQLELSKRNLRLQ
ncbi:MAG: prefoldin subunit [Candidatus Thorarchaeota archaeon]